MDLEALDLAITRRAGGEGRLFGSVGVIDIAEAAVEAGIEVQRNEVRMPDGPIRQTGRYQVSVRVHPDIEANVRVSVLPMGGSLEDFEDDADDADDSDGADDADGADDVQGADVEAAAAEEEGSEASGSGGEASPDVAGADEEGRSGEAGSP